jgi:hypothetical protein
MPSLRLSVALRLYAAAVCGMLLACVCALSARADWPDVYDPFRVRTIYLQMEMGGNWGSVVSDSDFNNPQNALLWTDEETPIQVTVKRKSDPAIGQKVSVKIDINARVSGQTWHGVKKLSLENGAEGGLVKEGFAWHMHRLASEAGFYSYPAAHAAWVRLVVDGQLIGAYTSVEERDKQMLENRGMWKENATWLYKNDPNPEIEAGTGNSPAFQHFCYPPFANGCAAPANFEADLTSWIDMQGMLTLGAIEAFTDNGDGLFSHDGKNHFFADFAPAPYLRRWYFPWDLDTGISQVNGPILGAGGEYSTRILGHAWFRQWFLHIMSDLINGPLSPAALTDFLNRLEPILTPVLEEDPNSSVEGDAAGHFQSLRNWVTNRVANVRGQIGPVIGPPVFDPLPGEIAAGSQLRLSQTNGSGTIYYTINGGDPRAVGGGVAGAAYSGPRNLSQSTHVKARVLVGTNWSALRQGTFNIANHAAGMKVTEIMYQSRPPTTNEDAGEYEFIEFQNRSATAIDLSGCYTTGIDFRFRPGTVIVPGDFIVLVRNALAFTNRYPGVAYDGIYGGGLDKDGEKIRLKNSDGNNIVSVEYDDEPPWPLGANGFGWSLVNMNPDADPDLPTNWRTSANVHGTPGAADPPPIYGLGVVINEVLAHTDPPQEDTIELHNPTPNAIDIGGWYLSDQIDNDDPTGSLLKKFRIPNGMIIPARGFQVFYASNFNNGANAFALSSYGDQVYLATANAPGTLTGGIVGARFGASDNGVSLGRHATSRGFDFAAMEALTFGASNAAPRIGPVVINELMYHPGTNGTEFIELYNRSAADVDLSGWTVEGASFVFAPGTTIDANSFLLLIGTTNVSPAQFRAEANVSAAVPIFGHTFDLGNAGENIELKRPNDFPTNAEIRVDRVRYNDRGPWPTEADGMGPSLERISPDVYGNEPLNWRTTRNGGSPGRPNAMSNVIAIVRGSSWKHNFLSRNLGTAWRMPGYSDSGWHTDRAPLGYGGSSLATVLTNPPGITTRPITTYFRKEFVVNDDSGSISNLTLTANYDDGFVAWLNGQEIVRRAMPVGSVTASTLADDHPASGYETIDVTAHKSLLQRGLNILAVEVHQSTANDPDLVWDADLTYTTDAEPQPTAIRITAFDRDPSAFWLQWDSVPGQSYRVQHSTDLESWTDTASSFTASSTTTRFTNNVPSASLRFYRVRSP